MHSIDSNTPRSWAERFSLLWPRVGRSRWQTVPGLRLVGDERKLPRFVQQCATTMSAIRSLALLDWTRVSGPSERHWFGTPPVPLAAYIGAFLIQLDLGLRTATQLHRFLATHPALVWALGFPILSADTPYGFEAQASLPTHRHFNRVLRALPNIVLQGLLDSQVAQLRCLLPDSFGQTISLDTKAILAWVKENNPKEYIKEGRFDKNRQPVGDPDCKLGCKRRHKRLPAPLSMLTPAGEGKPAAGLPVSIGEFYWGYASGVVATKLEGWGEFVLAEITQTFDKGETTYFFPLMEQVERRLGFRPRYGALDAGFDAFYIYDHFHSPDHDGFAAVPFTEKGGQPHRQFDDAGLPLCAAGLSMPLKFTYTDRTTAIIPYQRAKHVCPLLFPQPNGQSCPIEHKNWLKGGCSTHLANTPGARIRHQLDRESDAYRSVYAQRTASERIFSQAVELGIERPKLRNQLAITNRNTLIYLLINLRAIQRVLAQRALSNN